MKKIQHIFPRPSQPGMVGDGFRVYNYFPSGYPIRERVDPFLMLDFGASFYFPPSDKPRGVDVHPHRGFETVTIAYKGAVAHHDSVGNSGVIYPGDVQWMTAGSGILHKEYHEKIFSQQGGDFEMVQLWVNLPKQHKMTPPAYQEIPRNKMPIHVLPHGMGEIAVIAGDFENVKGAAKTFTPINVFDMRLSENAKLKFSVPSIHQCCLLVISGNIEIQNSKASTHDLILFQTSGEEIEINALDTAVLLFLSGEPIKEPIVQYGPFVMNSKEEIIQAVDDYNSGKFGFLN